MVLPLVTDKQAIKEQLRKSWQEEKKEFLNLFKKDKDVVKKKNFGANQNSRKQGRVLRLLVYLLIK